MATTPKRRGRPPSGLPKLPETPATPPPPSAPPPLAITTAQQQDLTRQARALTAYIIEQKRALALADFWFFLTQVLFPNTWQNHYTVDFHRPLCEAIQNTAPGEDLWFFLPRMHRKSYILTIAQSLWRIVRDPNIRILVVGAREETSAPFARLVTAAFVPGTAGFEEFHRIFPDFVIQKRTNHMRATSLVHPLRTVALADPTFRATYLGVTGAGWRTDILIADDCVERQKVTSPEISIKTTTQLLDLYPLIDRNPTYRMFFGAGTRWAYHDPYGRVIGDDRDIPPEHLEQITRIRQRSSVRVFVRHALELPDTSCTACPPHIVAAYPHGEPSLAAGAKAVCTPIHTRDSILAELDRYLIDPNRGESMFWHQWMNICRAPSDQRIQESWFVQAPFPLWPASRRRILCLDDASKDMQQPGVGDYSVALFGEYDDEGRLLLVHGLRSNTWTRDQFIRQIIAWCNATSWWPHLIVKEKCGTDPFLVDIQRAFTAVARACTTTAITRSSPNAMRKHDLILSNVQAPLERHGEVLFSSIFPSALFARVRYELCNLGQVRNDDMADTLALFFESGVRVTSPRRAITSPTPWRRLDLSNYGHAPPPAPPRNPAANPLYTIEDAARDVGTALNEPISVWHRAFAPAIAVSPDDYPS